MSVNTETQKSKHNLELVKWFVIVILFLVAIVGNYFYSDDMVWYLRLLAVLFIVASAVGMILITNKGKSIVVFTREARTELRKVIWPTRQETFHTTLIVTAVTIVISLILWVLDVILVHLVSFIIHLRFF